MHESAPEDQATQAPASERQATQAPASERRATQAPASERRATQAPRVLVAKHGNRSRTGRGSAEVLAELGVNIDADPERQADCLDAAGVCFCFAIHHHPAARHAAPARKALGFPTIFNLLGPLTNPAGAPRQLIGVYSPRYVEPLATALLRLGSEAAMVVHGQDGMDELSTTGPSVVAIVGAGAVRMEVLDPLSLGIPRATLADLAVPDLASGAAVIRAVLEGERGPRRDIVVLNAAAALWIAGACPHLAAGIDMASRAIDGGRAREALDRLARASHA